MRGQRHNLEGKRYGRLLVIGRHVSDKWKCMCDCGRTCTPKGSHLIIGASKSCGGCRWKGRAFRQILCEYKVCAKRRGIPWKLTEEQFRKITSSPCHYTGRFPSKVRDLGIDTFVYNGIDRKDSSKGYTLENCVACCSEANYAKMDMLYSDFIQLCKEVTQKTQN
jgi:hypothetical protein